MLVVARCSFFGARRMLMFVCLLVVVRLKLFVVCSLFVVLLLVVCLLACLLCFVSCVLFVVWCVGVWCLVFVGVCWCLFVVRCLLSVVLRLCFSV